jgi:hypothetical protein
MRGLKRVQFAVVLVGMMLGCCIPLNCCKWELPNICNLGKCFSADPCELLFLLLGGLANGVMV